MTEEERDAHAEVHDLRTSFPRGRIGRELAAMAVAAVEAAPDRAAREAALAAGHGAARYAEHLYAKGAYARDADLDGWFALPSLGVEGAARAWEAVKAGWKASLPAPDDEEAWARLDAEEEARDAERERQDRLEDDGWYGRTVPYGPGADAWIYVRFGRMPRDGRSVFGLAGEDTEEGPDPWRAELGGMTHEAGTCVLRARRHPDVPGAYLVMAPHFEHALYGISGFESYMLAIIPRYEEGEHPTVLRVDGFPVTLEARDKTLRLELGSDGEYLIDPRRPVAARALSLETVYVTEELDAASFLRLRRGYVHEPRDDFGDEAPAPGM